MTDAKSNSGPGDKKKPGFKEKIVPPKLKEETVEAKLARLEQEVADKQLPQPVTVSKPLADALKNVPAQAASGNLESNKNWNMAAFWLIVVLSIFCANVPLLGLFFYPVTQFVTMVHEMGHALAAILTGGHVGWMTIVGDGQGHGGLTGTSGGWQFLVVQAGYLFTTFFGCLLIYLGQYPRLSKAVLTAIGVAIMGGTLLFMVPTLLTFDPSRFVQGIFSIVWGLAMGGACVYMGRKLNHALSNLVVLFLAVQTALNSLNLLWVLVPHSLGLAGGGYSDATLMSRMIPSFPIFWVFLWVTISIVALFLTLKHTYGSAFLKRPRLKSATKAEE